MTVDSGDADALLELAPQLLEKRQRQHVKALEEGGHSDKIQDLMDARGEKPLLSGS